MNPSVISPINDIDAAVNAVDTTVNLFNHFDDPFTTGRVARFDLGGSVTNVVLFDQAGQGAPLTVQNFRDYINRGDYVNTIIHRSVPGFIVQGGGFTVNGLANSLDNPANAVGVIPSDDPVVNEFSPERSNLRGTIAMAKLGGDPDSATNQWFFNLEDNSANLDNQNGGFTVFGEVLGDSDLANIDAIAAIPLFNGTNVFGQGAFTDLPLVFDNPTNPVLTGDENFVRYNNITVDQQPELTFSVVDNSNPNLVNPIISNNQLVLDYVPEQLGSAEITIRATDLTGDFVDDTFSVTVSESGGNGGTGNDSLLDTSFFRFQNSNVPGTYLYASGAEAQNIRNNLPGFIEEGVAFNAAIQPNDELIPFYRFQSNQLPGTYLFVGEEERNGINADPNFSSSFNEEGIAFYVHGAGSNEETAFSRFQNSNVLGTYLYAAGAEANGIRNNFPNFIDEGIAFEARI